MYVNGINETGMVYLSMAREAQSAEREEIIKRAYLKHMEALRVVQDRSEKARLQQTFENFRRKIGFSSADVKTWAEKANRVASAPAAESEPSSRDSEQGA
jgi:hypothetical protein